MRLDAPYTGDLVAKPHPDQLKMVSQPGIQGVWFCMSRVPETSQAYVGSSDFKIYSVDFAAEKPEPQVVHELHTSYVTATALAKGKLVSGSYDRRLVWWDVEKGAEIRVVENAHAKWIRDVVIDPNGEVVATVADDMICRLWDLQTGKLLHELAGHDPLTPNDFPSMLFVAEFSPDGSMLATADKVGKVNLWEVASGKLMGSFESPENYTWDPRQRRHSIGGIRSLAFSPDGKSLAVGGMAEVGNIDHLGGKALVQVYDWKSGERTHEFASDRNKGLIEDLTYHPAGPWLVGAGGANGGFILFMDLEKKKFAREEDAKMHIHEFALNEAGDTMYCVGHGKISTWTM